MYSKNILIPKQLEMEILTCTHYLGLFKDDNDQTLGLTVGNFPSKFFEKNHKYYVYDFKNRYNEIQSFYKLSKLVAKAIILQILNYIIHQIKI